MGVHRSHFASPLAFATLLFAATAGAVETLDPRPVVWHADDRRPLEHEPATREPSLVWDYVGDGLAEPLECGLNEDYAKVLDFGLVKTDPSINVQDSLATTEVTTGTPAFMPPEQASAAGTVDARTDLYALGCVAYWLVTGRLVFEAESPFEMLVAHMRDEVIQPSKLSENEIDSNLEELILDCLQEDPAKRPGSAREVASRLRVCQASENWSTVQAVRWWDRHAPAGARALEGVAASFAAAN
jgi:hypothetical protein